MNKEERIAITSLISGWYACQVYGNKPSDKCEALKKEDEAYGVLLSLKVKADKWDEFKTPKGAVLGETKGCWPCGDSENYDITTSLNCPSCGTSVGQDSDGEYDIWFKYCPDCGQSIEQLSENEVDRLNKLFEEREQNE